MKEDDFFGSDAEQSDGQSFEADDPFFGSDDAQSGGQSSEADNDGFFGSDEEQSSVKVSYPPDDPTYYEKLSYDKLVYRRVQRWRRKAKRRGMEVPYLGYELHKPDKPRIFFWILAVLSAIIFAGIVVGIGFLYAVIIKNVTGMPDFGDAFKSLFDTKTMLLSFGLSALPGVFLVLIMIMLYLLIILALLLPLAAIFYFYRSVRDTFYMAKCSKEEFAKGNIIESRLIRLGAILAVMTVMFIALMIYVKIPLGRVLIGCIYAGLMLALGGLFALIFVEKHKGKKWFETLDIKEQQNYLAHDGGIRKIKRRKKAERDAWNSMFP